MGGYALEDLAELFLVVETAEDEGVVLFLGRGEVGHLLANLLQDVGAFFSLLLSSFDQLDSSFDRLEVLAALSFPLFQQSGIRDAVVLFRDHQATLCTPALLLMQLRPHLLWTHLIAHIPPYLIG